MKKVLALATMGFLLYDTNVMFLAICFNFFQTCLWYIDSKPIDMDLDLDEWQEDWIEVDMD